MLFNNKRELVRDYLGGESLCPECGGELLPRRGEVVVWHWAHRARRHKTERCSWEESSWHLRWKQAYLNFAGCVVEHPVSVEGNRYVLDAFNPTTNAAREFVHSLSPSYVKKHQALNRHFRGRVLWIWDGEEFQSQRSKYVRNGGIKGLLKPTAEALHQQVGGLVHFQEGEMAGLWRRWKADVWYKEESTNALKAFARSKAGQTA